MAATAPGPPGSRSTGRPAAGRSAGGIWTAAGLILGAALWATAVPPPTAAAGLAGSAGAAEQEFAWRLPPGFPRPRVPADNPMTVAKVELGRRLFFEQRLSGNGSQSCAHCHRPEKAFTDGRPRAVGSTGEAHPRSVMSLANVAYSPVLGWADPRLDRLEKQALVPLLAEHPVELGMAGREREILARLGGDPVYRKLFGRAFPDAREPVTREHLVAALASFERTLISGGSAWDRWLWWDEREAISESARRGARLFFSQRLGCSGCHAGFNFSGPVVWEGGPEPALEFHNTGLYNLAGRGAYTADGRGLIEHSGRPQDMGRFRAPTLRNIALTAPYMHDGSIDTLAEVVAHYAAGGRKVAVGPLAGDGRVSPFKSFRMRGFDVTPGQIGDLVAFLESLTDPAFVSDPRFSDPSP